MEPHLDKTEAYFFLKEILGCDDVSISDHSNWVNASCPLAKWTHSSGHDSHPSFGVYVPSKPDELPLYNCFTCKSSGSLFRLMHTLTWLSGVYDQRAVSFLLKHILYSREDDCVASEDYESNRLFVRELPDVTEEPLRIVSVPDKILKMFPLLVVEETKLCSAKTVIEWLTSERRISYDTICDFGLRLFSSPGGELGVVFPVIHKSGKVVDLFVRKMRDKVFFRLSPKLTGSHVDYNSRSVLFGDHLVAPGRQVILVEGAFDALRLYTLGVGNVLACFGTFGIGKARGVPSSSVVIAFDADSAGKDATEKAISLLCMRSQTISVADWGRAHVKDPGDLLSREQMILTLNKKALKSVHPIKKRVKPTFYSLTRGSALDKMRARLGARQIIS